MPERWGTRTYTRKDFDALCEIAPDMGAEAFARRLRAVGEGPDHALTVTLHGRRFRLETEAGGVVVKGGTRIG